jgi:hypothetical protein
MHDIILNQGIHMMHDQTSVDVVALYTKVARIVPENYPPAQISPLTRCIELLVDPPIETKRLTTNYAL